MTLDRRNPQRCTPAHGWASLAIPLLLVVTSWGCDQRSSEANDPLPLTIVVSGDTSGWIVPCGCTANQSGGMLRRGEYLRELRAKREVVYLDAGGAPAGDSPYDLAKFEAIIDGEQLLQVAAHNLGAAELRLGVKTLREINARHEGIFLSCNVRDNESKLIVPSWKRVEAADHELLIVGVVSATFAVDGIQIDPPQQAILKTIAAAKKRPNERLIVLAYLPETELLSLAGNLPEADLIIGGPTGQSIPPKQIGPVLLASATNKGKFLAVLNAAEQSNQPWSGEIVELNEKFADDSEQLANLDRYYQALAKRDFAANETSFTQTLSATIAAGYQVAGSAACRECHMSDSEVWSHTGHADAWSTLTATSAHVDSYCQQCHTTGYGMPGGFVSALRSANRVNVGCESCHGPSLEHAADPKRPTAFHTQAAGTCIKCHDRENSPHFDSETYWDRIRHDGLNGNEETENQ